MPELSPQLGTVPRLGALTEIIAAVAAVYGLDSSHIAGPLRSKAIAEARLCVYLIARRCTRLSSVEIGGVLRRDHTTVLAGIKSAERMRLRDAWFAATASELLEQFGAAEERAMQ